MPTGNSQNQNPANTQNRKCSMFVYEKIMVMPTKIPNHFMPTKNVILVSGLNIIQIEHTVHVYLKCLYNINIPVFPQKV